MSAQWKDVSTYSRTDKERRPWAWEIRLDIWRLTVVYNHRDYPGKYIYYIPGVVGDTLLTLATHEDEAKIHALLEVELLVARIVSDIEEALQ